MTFNELELIEPIIEAVKQLEYKEPSPIQEQSIPVLLQGKDLLGCAKTGTGKTIAFALPILQKLYLRKEEEKYPRKIKALIIAPTRELAIQINETFEYMRPFVNIKSTVIFGGVKQGKQVETLKKGVDVLVATPGRLADLHNQKLLDLRHVEYFVLDEADRMLDMGFITDIRKIIRLIPKDRQTMLFSATIPNEIKHLVNEILNNPERIMISSGNDTVEKINQSLYYVDKENKAKLLIKLFENPQMFNAIVFVRTKRNADTLCKKLVKAGIDAESIHGDKSQNARVRALNNFKDHKARVLVATDIAARGIDIEFLTHVVNFDLPDQAENYVHRIGRTARAGADGDAITFCSFQEKDDLKAIQKFMKQEIPVKDNPYYPMENFTNKSKEKEIVRKPSRNKKPMQSKNNFDSKKPAQSKNSFDSKKPAQSRNKFSKGKPTQKPIVKKANFRQRKSK